MEKAYELADTRDALLPHWPKKGSWRQRPDGLCRVVATFAGDGGAGFGQRRYSREEFTERYNSSDHFHDGPETA